MLFNYFLPFTSIVLYAHQKVGGGGYLNSPFYILKLSKHFAVRKSRGMGKRVDRNPLSNEQRKRKQDEKTNQNKS